MERKRLRKYATHLIIGILELYILTYLISNYYLEELVNYRFPVCAEEQFSHLASTGVIIIASTLAIGFTVMFIHGFIDLLTDDY